MKTPMILPWLAHKAGISEKRAEKLWADSLRYATAKTGWVGTSEYWHVAMDRLLRLMAREAATQRQATSGRFEPMRPSVWMYPFVAWHGLFLIASSAWQKLATTGQARQAH